MTSIRRLGINLAFSLLVGAAAAAQTPPPRAPTPELLLPPLPPATRLERFSIPDGGMVTTGYERMGEIDGIVVEAREVRDSTGVRARGVVVSVAGEAGVQQSFVDDDEFPDLLNAIDALQALAANPTGFRNFETTFATRGELHLIAASSRSGAILYAIEVGRTVKMRRSPLTAGDLHQLKSLFEAAANKFATLPVEK